MSGTQISVSFIRQDSWKVKVGQLVVGQEAEEGSSGLEKALGLHPRMLRLIGAATSHCCSHLPQGCERDAIKEATRTLTLELPKSFGP